MNDDNFIHTHTHTHTQLSVKLSYISFNILAIVATYFSLKVNDVSMHIFKLKKC
jgi:hypothetical protein